MQTALRHSATTTTVRTAPLSVLRGFHPGWFGAVMGTAIVGTAAYLNPGDVGPLQPAAHVVGQAFTVLAVALAIGLGVPYVLRWTRHTDAALADLRDPVLGALYGTFPGGILVLAATIAVVGPSLLPAGVVTPLVAGLAVVGTTLAFATSVLFAYLLFVGPGTAVEKVNGGWFIPPVVTIVVPMALSPLVGQAPPAMARFLLFAAYAFWGMGFLLFLLVASLLHDRLVLHPLPAAPLAPSLWIGLGPVGVGSLALIKMAQAGSPVWGDLAPTVTTLSEIAAAALWGFGLWWLAAATLLLRRYLQMGRLPYGLGWWAFTFPLGAYTVSTLTIARVWHVGAVEVVGALLFVGLVCFWAVVTTRTVAATHTGELWRR